MPEIGILWTEENRRHLVVDHAERGITTDEVDEILLDLATKVVRRYSNARWDRIGVTKAGRPLLVRGLGQFELSRRQRGR